MTRRRRLWTAARTRRIAQIAFLLLFAGLVVAARPRPDGEVNHLVELFFHLDPLILIATWLSAHAVEAGALVAVVTIAVTALAGRVFCGWLCPLGTIHAAAGRFLRWAWPVRHRKDHWSRWQLAKYYLLIALLVMAALGSHWVCVFDPIVLLYRTTTTALFPGAQWAVEEGATAVFQADPGVGPVRLTAATEPVYGFLRDHVFVVAKQAFLGSGLILALFTVMVLANRWRPRFWCRYVCPLGALLGLFAWRPLLRRKVRHENCNQCDLCGMNCHGAAAVEPAERWKPSECLGCFNCTESCRRGALGFTLAGPWAASPRMEGVDLSKRAVFAAAVGGLAALATFRATPQARGNRFHPLLIRPPGSRGEREFLARCTACGLCMKVCPTGGLQPSVVEAGLEGLWSPRLVPEIGYCDYECNLCGQVCPTEAIAHLELEEKQKTRIGLAAFDTTRCIPYTYGRECIVCEEHCPIPDKAIFTVEVEIVLRDGQRKTVKQPKVDPDKCIGCGVCEHVCPYKDRPGIRVTSANEARNPENQPIGPGDSPYGAES
jgi:polyferredoxin/formate hydrogenlyase subunit 6/NADH:ubiquinone oxidoreductase subunit I